MSQHEISITSQKIEVRNSWSEFPSGLPLMKLFEIRAEILEPKFSRAEVRLPGHVDNFKVTYNIFGALFILRIIDIKSSSIFIALS